MKNIKLLLENIFFPQESVTMKLDFSGLDPSQVASSMDKFKSLVEPIVGDNKCAFGINDEMGSVVLNKLDIEKVIKIANSLGIKIY